MARDDWAASFIAECRISNLELVSITDHHDMTFVPYVVRAGASDKFTLVLPGVEVTRVAKRDRDPSPAAMEVHSIWSAPRASTCCDPVDILSPGQCRRESRRPLTCSC